MKSNKTIMGAVSVILTAFLMFTACSDILNPPEAVDSGDSTGTLMVQMGEAGRTLAPKGTELDGLSYKLTIYQGDYENPDTVAFEGDFDATAAYTLAAGDWNISAGAFNSENQLVAGAEASVTIAAGKTAQANLILKPVYAQDIPGTFTWNISFPDEDTISYTNLSAELVPDSNDGKNSGTFTIDMDVQTAANGVITVAGTQALPPGVYTLKIKLTSDRQIQSNALAVNRMEVVYIYPGMTTDATFAFTDADFTADVVLSGTATVYESSGSPHVNTDYIPNQVHVFNTSGTSWQIVKSAPITLNEETGDYEWEISVPSHEAAEQLTNATLQFEAIHKDSANKTISSPPTDANVVYPYGKSDINLSMKLGTLTSSVDFTGVGTGGKIELSNSDIGQGGYTAITITNPSKYALIGSSLKVNGTNAWPTFTFENGKITAGITTPSTSSSTVTASFFHLKGTTSVSSTTEGYKPVKIEAFEPGAEEGDDPISIGFVAPTQVGTTDDWAWEIPIPAGYIWQSESDDVKLVMTLAAAGQVDQVNESEYTITFFTNDAAVISDSVTLFAVKNVQTTALSADTIRITWDEADWAAGGYKVYMNDGTDHLIQTLSDKAVTSYDYTSTSMTPETDYWFYVVGRKNATDDGNQSNWPLGRVKQPQPANLNISGGTSLGYLSSVSISWDAVPTANGYKIEKTYDNGVNWEDGTETDNTFWTDNDVIPVNANIKYRVIAKDSSDEKYYSLPKETVISAPYAENINLGVEPSFGQIEDSGQKKVYLLNNTNYETYLYFFDFYNQSSVGDETLDAYFNAYRWEGSNVLSIFDGDDTLGSSVDTYYNPMLIVVRAYDNTSIGSYRLMVQ